MRAEEANAIRVDVEKSFSFLLGGGFSLGEVKALPMGDWEIKLESSDCALYLFTDRAQLNASFGPAAGQIRDEFAIQVMIYFLSNGQILLRPIAVGANRSRRAALNEIALLVRQNFDQIRPLFGQRYESLRPELTMARSRYVESATKEDSHPIKR